MPSLENEHKMISFIGPEGSGKTLNAKRLSKELNLPYVSTGDILRGLAANDPGPLGDECRHLFAKHIYLSPKSMLEVFETRFKQGDLANGFVLDGGLRTQDETVGFPELLRATGLDHLELVVIYLKIPRSVSLERLVTGEKARKRKDDTVEGVNQRLDEFYFLLDERLALIKAQESWTLITIDAKTPIEKVYQRVYKAATENGSKSKKE